MGWKTLSAFALVLGAGVGVFVFLPRFVSERPVAEAPPSEIAAPKIAEAPPEVPAPAPPPPTGPPFEAVEEKTAPVDASVEGAPVLPDASEEAFAAAMTEALSALKNEDYAIAREAFERAQALRPEAPEAASGLSQVEEGLRTRAIAGHRDRGLELERLENWRAAEAEYDSALTLDSSLRFAQEGKKRSAARAHLSEKLDFQIAHPERLSDRRALEEASRLLDEARGVEPSGPRQREALVKLEELVASFSQPVEVSIVSDTLTDITLQRIGRLGKFDRRVLEIRPGRYVVTGSRAGFKDVRIELLVEPGKPPVPILVRCEEAI